MGKVCMGLLDPLEGMMVKAYTGRNTGMTIVTLVEHFIF